MSEKILTVAQMRALEDAAIASGTVTGLELMERAGAGAVDAILAKWPELGPGSRAVVLFGPGNNGGDGFVVARLLHERGWRVDCYLYGDVERLPPDAKVNLERFNAIRPVASLGFPTLELSPTRKFINDVMGNPESKTLPPAGPIDLWVDAVFGTGLRRPLDETFLNVLLQSVMPDGDLYPKLADTPKFVALDVPTGFDADTGRFFNGAYEVHLCIAFHRAKVGHYLDTMPLAIRKLVTVDLGLGDDWSTSTRTTIVTRPDNGEGWIPTDVYRWPGKAKTPRHQFGIKTSDRTGGIHKFDHGHALVLAGGVGRGGAGRLAARAALRIGAGLVTLAPPPAALIENACRLDAIMLRAVRDAEALAELLEDDRINALCLGPGLGTGVREASLVRAAISSGRLAVLDGDALTLLAADDTLRGALHKDCVLTPHMGEFARLAPDLAERLTAPAGRAAVYSKLDAARDLAARLGVTVLLKGADTVIARPDGRAAIHAAAYGREAPWLATAGAGDVLAGLIAGLLARGFEPMQACEAAAWLHVEAARTFGPGLIAEDLPETIPAVLRALEA